MDLPDLAHFATPLLASFDQFNTCSDPSFTVVVWAYWARKLLKIFCSIFCLGYFKIILLLL
jgi:hypothetical protein